jgi:hypothetical protein
MFGLRVRLDPPSSPPSHTQPPPGPPRSRGPLVAPGPGPAGLDRGLRAWQGYFTALSSSSAAGAFAFLASSLVGLTGPGAVEGPELAWLWGRLEGSEGWRRRPSPPLEECLRRPPSSMGGWGGERSMVWFIIVFHPSDPNRANIKA